MTVGPVPFPFCLLSCTCTASQCIHLVVATVPSHSSREGDACRGGVCHHCLSRVIAALLSATLLCQPHSCVKKMKKKKKKKKKSLTCFSQPTRLIRCATQPIPCPQCTMFPALQMEGAGFAMVGEHMPVSLSITPAGGISQLEVAVKAEYLEGGGHSELQILVPEDEERMTPLQVCLQVYVPLRRVDRRRACLVGIVEQLVAQLCLNHCIFLCSHPFGIVCSLHLSHTCITAALVAWRVSENLASLSLICLHVE